MDRKYLERLRTSFKTENYKKIYVDLLKFFNSFEEFISNEELTIKFLEILVNNRGKLVFGEKEKLLNETVAEVYQKVDFLAESDFLAEKSESFFKKQINDLISREINKLRSLLDNPRFHMPLIKVLSFLFNHLQIKITETIQELLEYYILKITTFIQLKTLVDPLFDQFPLESLIAIIDILNNKQSVEDLYQILNSFSEIYPELYYENIHFFFERLDSDLDLIYKEIVAHIIYNVALQRSSLFVLNFFELLNILNNVFNQNNKKVIYYLEMSLKSIFSNNSFGIFEYFKKELNENFELLLNLMHPNYIQINDILNEYYIEYLNYVKVFYHNGKVSKELLEICIKILNYLVLNNLTNEYFLFSLISQLKLDNFQLNLEKLDNDSDKKELEKRYQDLISEIKNYIKIIF